LAAISFATCPVTDASVRRNFSLRHDLDARLLRLRAEYGVPVVAVGIVEPDDPDRLHARLHHVADESFRDETVVLRGLEYPALLVVHRQHDGRGADRRQHRRARLGHEGTTLTELGEPDGPISASILVLGEELLDEDHALRRVARVVEHEVLDCEIADLLRQQRGRVLLRNADDRGRTGRRGDHADLQLRANRRRNQREGERDEMPEVGLMCRISLSTVESLAYVGTRRILPSGRSA
jgi:hypothetical protein